MSRILIFGGHGRVALLLAPILVEQGDEVTAVIRNPDHSDDVAATGANPHLADISSLDGDDLTELISGHDAVVWSAGAGGGSAERTYAIDRDAAIRTMDAASKAGVKRYVMVSWIGSRPDHGVPEDDDFFAYADAKLAADQHLTASELDFTVLGPGTLTLDAGTGKITLSPEGNGEVPRADVAAVIAASLADTSTIGRTIRFGSGDTSIADAVRG
ncbi:uncharacterized protein YbjT (DUF2867 family) [Microbacterium endophyticum]|uniref:Uncharacterized protein YbjT (DUF2867 family) n=1 Tax=Microbacterium endophyticum TaxID=1526412 RepID=A0A7W4V4N4_9MICO|nr:SDR family oxidoreductase [Microbacterium endophyticum]MBB2976798.1 uncharacterized protein YbjT (DUF2867 family) [Microbacterium endophyticum]NIK36565.1 uncharacterized protein YbjT (DUF2867 family) [Microbacterium endophyticum]